MKEVEEREVEKGGWVVGWVRVVILKGGGGGGMDEGMNERFWKV